MTQGKATPASTARALKAYDKLPSSQKAVAPHAGGGLAALKGKATTEGTVNAIQQWLTQEDHSFASLGLADVQPLPSDYDRITTEFLCGVHIFVTDVELAFKAFGDNEPKLTAIYTIYIVDRIEDIGKRQLWLASGVALAEARKFKALLKSGATTGMHATVEYRKNVERGYTYAHLEAPRSERNETGYDNNGQPLNTDVRYLHRPWGEDLEEPETSDVVDATSDATPATPF